MSIKDKCILEEEKNVYKQTITFYATNVQPILQARKNELLKKIELLETDIKSDGYIGSLQKFLNMGKLV